MDDQKEATALARGLPHVRDLVARKYGVLRNRLGGMISLRWHTSPKAQRAQVFYIEADHTCKHCGKSSPFEAAISKQELEHYVRLV